jgi:hypothetical protein
MVADMVTVWEAITSSLQGFSNISFDFQTMQRLNFSTASKSQEVTPVEMEEDEDWDLGIIEPPVVKKKSSGDGRTLGGEDAEVQARNEAKAAKL